MVLVKSKTLFKNKSKQHHTRNIETWKELHKTRLSKSSLSENFI